MMILKWPLSQTIIDGYSLRKHLVKYSECFVLDINEVGVIGVRKKKKLFIRRNEVHVTFKVQVPI